MSGMVKDASGLVSDTIRMARNASGLVSDALELVKGMNSENLNEFYCFILVDELNVAPSIQQPPFDIIIVTCIPA